MPTSAQKNGILYFRILFPFAFGYFLSYLYRVVNAIIAPDLIRDFSIEPGALGLLTGAYFLTFAAAQLPLGVVLDRYGARRTEPLLLLFAALGAVVFASAETFSGLILGRALIGLGVSACLMAAFKAFVVWFPKERLPLINGVQWAGGGLGAIAATTPVEAALTLTDWRGIFFGVAVLTLLCAGLIYGVVPDDSKATVRAPARVLFKGVSRVFASGLFWRLAPVTVLSQATFLAIQGLWSGPWLRTVDGLSRSDAAPILFAIAVAMLGGFLGLGWIADRLGRIGVNPVTVALSGMGCFMISQALIISGWLPAAAWPWILFGFFGTTGSVSYAALSQRFPADLAGRLNTALNMLVFVAAFVGQWGIGEVIEVWSWLYPETEPAAGYRVAFALMLGLQTLGLVWYAAFRRADVPSA
jgi:MFS family permease